MGSCCGLPKQVGAQSLDAGNPKAADAELVSTFTPSKSDEELEEPVVGGRWEARHQAAAKNLEVADDGEEHWRALAAQLRKLNKEMRNMRLQSLPPEEQAGLKRWLLTQRGTSL